ncbi:ethylmalonyl-CoA decarboxylase isoform X3 [Kryptolebias marmoratus]|uniref:ethylmalonyl-CoA decarboxylase isoform X3 n=1 Tax=Kryptolebias marmoratus TaxID=37003 RepID=UPI000D5311D0|nr:ethylmalonyl-CoA decarboxylase isoform X3 [Kryptolebias marmoratus]
MVSCALKRALVRSSSCCGVWSRLLQRPSRGCVSSSLHVFDRDEIRQKLRAFPGGSVDLLKQDSGVAVLTINNPSRMNAFSGSMMVDLEERVTQLEKWADGKGLIVQGADETFCSGSDLNAVRAISNPQTPCRMGGKCACSCRMLLQGCLAQAASCFCCFGGGESFGRRCRTHYCLRFQINDTRQRDPVCPQTHGSGPRLGRRRATRPHRRKPERSEAARRRRKSGPRARSAHGPGGWSHGGQPGSRGHGDAPAASRGLARPLRRRTRSGHPGCEESGAVGQRAPSVRGSEDGEGCVRDSVGRSG